MWSNIVNYLFKLPIIRTQWTLNKVPKKIHFQSNRASSLSKRRRRFPSVSEIDFILICKKVTKIKSGLQLFQMEAAVNQFFVVLILPPQSFCSIWRKLCQCRSETKWRLQMNSNYLVIKNRTFWNISRHSNLVFDAFFSGVTWEGYQIFCRVLFIYSVPCILKITIN